LKDVANIEPEVLSTKPKKKGKKIEKKVEAVVDKEPIAEPVLKSIIEPLSESENNTLKKDEMSKDMARNVLMNFEEDSVPSIMNKTPKTLKPKETSNQLYIAEMQTLKREHEALKRAFDLLQTRGVDEANQRFEEFKSIAETRFEESEQLISMLQKENERLKSGNCVVVENPKVVHEIQDLKAKLIQQQAKEDLQTETLTALLNEKKQLEHTVKSISSELKAVQKECEELKTKCVALDGNVTTWKSEYEVARKSLELLSNEHSTQKTDFENSIKY
jgi:DNA repair exonuclease SbcCD ATPase subunit